MIIPLVNDQNREEQVNLNEESVRCLENLVKVPPTQVKRHVPAVIPSGGRLETASVEGSRIPKEFAGFGPPEGSPLQPG